MRKLINPLLLLVLCSFFSVFSAAQEFKGDAVALREKIEKFETESYLLKDSNDQVKYIDALNELGDMYLLLSTAEAKSKNLNGALKAFEKAAIAGEENDYSKGAAKAFLGVAKIYQLQARGKKESRILKLSIEHFNNASEFAEKDGLKDLIYPINGNKGISYLRLAFLENQKENLENAIKFLKTGSKGYDWNAKEGPALRFRMMLGIAHYFYSTYERRLPHIRTAIIYFRNLLDETEYSEETDEKQRIMLMLDAATAEKNLNGLLPRTLESGSVEYFKALYDWTPYWLPGESTAAAITSAEKYMELYENNDSKLYLVRTVVLMDRCVELYKKIVFKEEKYAKTLINLGMAQTELGEKEKNTDLLEKGIYNLRVGRKVIIASNKYMWARATLFVVKGYIATAGIENRELNLEKAGKEFSKLTGNTNFLKGNYLLSIYRKMSAKIK